MNRTGHAVALTSIAVGVLVFTGAWTGGDLVLDGPGHVLWVETVLETWRTHGRLFTWWPQMWSGSPAFLLAPSPQIVGLVPLAAMVGPEWASKISGLTAQVVAGWGMYVFAWSMWRRRVPALVGGLAYALHPIVVSHVGLFGYVPSGWVLASLGWFAWSLRRTYETSGSRFVVATGGIAAFAALSQGEVAYVLGFLVVAYAVLAARTGPVRAVVTRTALVVALAVGLSAFWLVGALWSSDPFALNPEELVQAELVRGAATTLARTPSAYLTRTTGWDDDAVTFDADAHFANGTYYLGGAVIVLAALGMIWLRSDDREGWVSATTVAGAAGLWASTASVPLWRSLTDSVWGWIAVGVIAIVTVHVVATYARRAKVGRWPAVAAGVAAVALGLAVAPFGVLRHVVPLLTHVRFPRLYALAPFAIVVVATFALVAASERLRGRLPAVVALAAIVAVFVDVAAYASVYRLRAPDWDVPAVPGRTATREWWDPSEARAVRTTSNLSTGWPHPIAGREAWRLAAATWGAPHDYTLRALGLAATKSVVHDVWHPPRAMPSHGGLYVTPNGHALEDVRAYRRVVVGEDPATATHLAALAAHDGVGVITGDRTALGSLDGLEVVSAPGALEAARARARVMVHSSRERLRVAGDRSAGIRLRAAIDGLAGVAFDLDRAPGAAYLVLGDADGEEILRTREAERGPDGLWRFAFEPVADSAGRTFRAELRCPVCDRGPWLAAIPADDGDLLRSGALDERSRAVATPVYEPVEPAPRPQVRLERREPRPGEVVIDVEADEPALVVSADAYFPGWEATVDGVSRPVLQADGAFLGVVVGPGVHQIRLGYRAPATRTVGRAISGLTAAMVLAFGGWRLRTYRRGSSLVASAARRRDRTGPKNA